MDQTAKPPTDDSSVFFIGEPGICTMAVCVPAALTREQIAVEANAKNPTGIGSPWAVTDAADLSDYDGPYPVQCPDEDGRRHYMMHC
jgi:hypothetical protein